MSPPKTQRIRDPIHNLIIFDEKDDVDQLAWRLINTPEFQRLRRIRQLGLTELVFPGATHTRFAHSIGVYHNARRLIRWIDEHLQPQPRNTSTRDRFASDRSVVIRLAALLHDIGHGPLSHAFEGARLDLAKIQGLQRVKRHEFYSAELIRNSDSQIYRFLSESDPKLPQQVAEVIEADDPADIYHAVLSSSFDADRLDYLLRDRYMTGTHAGAIDIEWLINNLVIQQIPLSREEDDLQPTLAPTFAFAEKARSAAEDFLLARYRLFATVYLHKATRGFEQIVSALVRWLGTEGNASRIGIEATHPLISFLLADGDGDVSDYARLDDFMLWGLIERISRCNETKPKMLAQCMLDRMRPKCLDISKHHGNSLSLVASTDSKIQEKFQRSLGTTVFRDSAVISAYKQINGDPAKEHKRIRVRTSTSLEEITSFTESLISREIQKERSLVRYYFLDPEDFEAARETAERGH